MFSIEERRARDRQRYAARTPEQITRDREKDRRRSARMKHDRAVRRAARQVARAARQVARERERLERARLRAERPKKTWKESHAGIVRRRRSWWAEQLASITCVECGEAHPRTIEFHHPGEKRARVPALVARGRAEATILKEVSRCRPLCANCHRKTHGQPTLKTKDPARLAYRTWWAGVRDRLECSRCGETHPAVFEYRQRDPSDDRVRDLVKNEVAKPRVLAALTRCEVLCANCRRKHHPEDYPRKEMPR